MTTNDYVWAPGIIGSLLADPDMTAALANPLPRPCHDPGTAVEGCATFPPDWTAEVLEARIRETLANGYRPRIGDTYLYWKDYDEERLCVLQREDASGERRTIAAYPCADGPRTSSRPRPDDVIAHCATVMFDALDNSPADDADTDKEFGMVGNAMYEAGQVAESLMWMLKCVLFSGLRLPEDVYMTLYVMALKGFLSSSQEYHPEEVVAAAWARAHPATWGLPGRLFAPSIDCDVPRGSITSPGQIAAAAARWLGGILPRTGLTKASRARMIDSAFRTDANGVTASFGSDQPARLEGPCPVQPDGSESEPIDRWTLTLSGNPRSGLAELSLILAVGGLGQCDVDCLYTPPLDPDARAMREWWDDVSVADAVRRMVLVERALNVVVG